VATQRVIEVERAEDVARRAVRAVALGDVTAMELLYAPGVRLCHEEAGAPPGIAGVRERALRLATLLWDTEVDVLSCRPVDRTGAGSPAGRTVVVAWEVRGRHRSVAAGSAGLPELARVCGTSVLRVDGGQVVEDWTELSTIRTAGPIPLAG